jgi:FkbM family methyltransferase
MKKLLQEMFISLTESKLINNLLKRVGKKISPNFEPSLKNQIYKKHLKEIFDLLRINCVLDVGAMHGGYGILLRQIGYDGYILSFEPVPENYVILGEISDQDPKWTAYQYALGDVNTELQINVASHRNFSSFLVRNSYSKEEFGKMSVVEDTLKVKAKRLEDIISTYVPEDIEPRIFLKMDTQGYDINVFKGLGTKIDYVYALQSEVSVKPIYDDMVSYSDAISFYSRSGFELSEMFSVVHDRCKRVIEFDCLMIKNGTSVS